ncbi:MAG TPA: universal stress protein [Gaiellaceae bacterium]|jgi:nucleotide-binding universal stress UspA family protein|nr:universal stress protein [Gaiellaceae bacterium]
MEPTAAAFERIVCGIDGTPQSLEALAQAQRLLAPAGRLELVTVADVSVAVHAGWAATHVFDEIVTAARDAAARAAEHAPAAATCVLEGEPARSLLQEIAREQATLVALGTHGHRRSAGLVLGNTATTLLHEAPCAVLIARPPLAEDRFPSSVVVGVDGSAHSRNALDVARAVATRFSVPLNVVCAGGGKAVSGRDLRGVTDLVWDERRPVDALVAAGQRADLLVVGSRGLHGFSALGSVSERVAHRSRSSVLVVR